MKSFQLTLTERDYADLYALLRELGERLGDDERAALVFSRGSGDAQPGGEVKP